MTIDPDRSKSSNGPAPALRACAAADARTCRSGRRLSGLRTGLLAASLLLTGCPGGDDSVFGDRPDLVGSYGATTDAQFVVRYMKDWYLWNDTLGLAPSEDYPSGQAAIDALKYRDDRFSNVASADDYNRFFDEGKTIGFGFSYRIEDDQQSIRLLMVQSESPARRAGLQRGDVIEAIDDVTVATLIAQESLGAALGPLEEGIVRRFAVRRDGNAQSVSVTKALYDISYVMGDAVFEQGGRKIGYVNFYSFANLGVAPWREALDRLIAQGAQDIIVDLRNNGGGLLSTTATIGAALGSGSLGNSLMSRLTFNDGHAQENRSFAFAADPARAGRFENLVWLTGKSTCSASEALILGLDPYRRGIRVGETTCGKPVGFTPPQFRDKVYSIVSFRLQNAQGVTDYFDGLPPDCPVSDTGTGQFGQADEPLTAAALARLATGACASAASADTKALDRTHPDRLTGTRASFSRMINLW